MSEYDVDYDDITPESADDGVLENDKGITIAHHSLLEDSQPSGPGSTVAAAGLMKDPEWSFKDVSARKVFIANYQWTTGGKVGDKIFGLDLPTDILTNSTIMRPFQAFVYFKGDMELEFVLTGSQYHLGQLCIYYVPLVKKEIVDGWHGKSRITQTSVQHCFVEPVGASTQKMKINWRNIITRLDLGDNDTVNCHLGYIACSIFSVLRAPASSSNTLTISVFARFQDAQFTIPTVRALPSGINHMLATYLPGMGGLNSLAMKGKLLEELMRQNPRLRTEVFDSEMWRQHRADSKRHVKRLWKIDHAQYDTNASIEEEDAIPEGGGASKVENEYNINRVYGGWKQETDRDRFEINADVPVNVLGADTNTDTSVRTNVESNMSHNQTERIQSNKSEQFDSKSLSAISTPISGNKATASGSASGMNSAAPTGGFEPFEAIPMPRRKPTSRHANGQPKAPGRMFVDGEEYTPDASRGLDRPGHYGHQIGVFRRLCGRFAAHDGVDSFDMLSYEQVNQQIPDHETFSTKDDENKLTIFTRNLNFFQSVTWTTATAAQARLMTLKVSPIPIATPDKTTTPVPGVQFATQMFRYWSGSIYYRIQIVASNFHKGKLWLGCYYGSTEPTKYSEAFAQYGLMLDLDQEQKIYDVSVPFLFDKMAAVVPQTYIPGTPADAQDETPATIALYVVNPLTDAVGISNTVDILMYMCGGEDFELSIPDPTAYSLYLPRTYIAETSRPPSCIDEEDEFVVPESDTSAFAVPTPGLRDPIPLTAGMKDTTVNVSVKHFGERITSVTELCKRFVATRYDFVHRNYSKISWQPTNNLGPTGGSTLEGFTVFGSSVVRLMDYNVMIAFWRTPYRLWFGAMRARLIFRSSPEASSIMSAVYYPYPIDYNRAMPNNEIMEEAVRARTGDPSSDFASAATIAPMSLTNSVNPVIEVELPFINHHLSAIVEKTNDDDSYSLPAYTQSGGLEVYVRTSSTSTNVPLDLSLFTAVSDELRFGCFLGIPFVYACEDCLFWPAVMPKAGPASTKPSPHPVTLETEECP